MSYNDALEFIYKTEDILLVCFSFLLRLKYNILSFLFNTILYSERLYLKTY